MKSANRRIDEWIYILVLGGWAGFVDSLIRKGDYIAHENSHVPTRTSSRAGEMFV